MNFAIGNTLRCIDATDGLTNGKQYTVTRAGNGTSVRVTNDEGRDFGYYESRFELIAVPAGIKKGDRVRVVRAVPGYDKNGMGVGKMWRAAWADQMNAALGGEFVVAEYDDTYGARLETRTGRWNFPLAALELAPVANGIDAQGNPLNFTDADLKLFQRVKLRNDKLAIVTENAAGSKGFTFASRSWMPANVVADSADNGYDVVEVYAAPHYLSDALTVEEFGDVVWKKADAAKIAAIKAANAAVEQAAAELAAAKAARAAL